MAKEKSEYVSVAAWAVPPSVYFACPARLSGQMRELEYGAFGRGSLPDFGAPYKRVTDRSTGQVAYFKLHTRTEYEVGDRVSDGWDGQRWCGVVTAVADGRASVDFDGAGHREGISVDRLRLEVAP